MIPNRPVTPSSILVPAATMAAGHGSVLGFSRYWYGYWFSAGVPAAVS